MNFFAVLKFETNDIAEVRAKRKAWVALAGAQPNVWVRGTLVCGDDLVIGPVKAVSLGKRSKKFLVLADNETCEVEIGDQPASFHFSLE